MQYIVKIYGSRGCVVAERTTSSEEKAREWAENWLWYNGDVGYYALCSDSAGNSIFDLAV